MTISRTDANRGHNRGITIWGDSLAAGTGASRNLGAHLLDLAPNRIITTHAIGGQKLGQIFARQGGVPVPLTLVGNAFNGTAEVSVSMPATQQILSTPAENNTRIESGMLAGTPCYITRTATGGPPSTLETYTVRPFLTTTSAVPAGSLFYPDDGFNAKNLINIFWAGRNNTPTFTGLNAGIDRCIDALDSPARALVIGVLNASTETTGTSNSNAIVAQNNAAAALYGSRFVAATPPTTEEMSALSYTPSAQDLIDIAAGVYPAGMRADSVHLNDFGYRVFALRTFSALKALGWVF